LAGVAGAASPARSAAWAVDGTWLASIGMVATAAPAAVVPLMKSRRVKLALCPCMEAVLSAKNHDRDLCMPALLPTKRLSGYNIADQLAKTTATELVRNHRSIDK
jgi:hypothetical protein